MTAPDEDPGEGPGESVVDGPTLERRFQDANDALDAASTDAFEKYLKPFAETFGQLHAVRLVEVAVAEAVPELRDIDVQAREVAAEVLRELVEDGAGQVLQAALMLGIKTAAKSPKFGRTVAHLRPANLSANVSDVWTKGVAKSRQALPGAEALFRQTNRTLVKNKKLLIIGTLSAAAVGTLLAVWHDEVAEKEAAFEAERAQKRREVEARRAEVAEALNRGRLQFATQRAEEATETLMHLVDLGLSRLPDLRALVAADAEYDTYEKADRFLVAELAGLAQTVAAVIAASVDAPASQGPGDDQAPVLDAARRVVSRYARQRNPGSDAAPAVSWVVGQISTTVQREQLAFLAQQPDFIGRLAKRCGASHQRVKEGFHFEWLHELGFNLDAIAKDSSLRAHVTEFLGRPADPADVVVETADGSIAREFQMKVVESKSKRVGPNNGLIDRDYEGMGLVVPTDHVGPTEAFLGLVSDRPATAINRPRYEDAGERLTDVVSHDGISSDPITTGQLTAAANDPEGHLRRVAADVELQRVVNAAVAAGGAAVLTSLGTDLVAHLYAEHTFNGFNWAQASVAGARTGAATMAAAAAGTFVRAAGERAVADGSANFFQSSWAHGDHGPALTQAAIDIAGIIHGLATDRLTSAEAAEATTKAIVRSSITWVSTAAVRSKIDDAEMAALVGGIVGQHGSQLIMYGLRVAILGRDPHPRWDEKYAALLEDTAALKEACVAESEELHALGQQHRNGFTERVIPALDRLNAARGAGSAAAATTADEVRGECDPDAQLVALATIADEFACTPLFDSLEVFDAFMADPNSVLVLRGRHA